MIKYIVYCPVRHLKFESTDEVTGYHLSKRDLEILVGLSRNNEYVQDVLHRKHIDNTPNPAPVVRLSRFMNEGVVGYNNPQYFTPVNYTK